MQRTFRPRYLSFAGTYQCNLSCPHCCVPIEWTDRLDIATATRFLEDAHAEGIRTLGFTGGEPFLYPEFLQALSRRAAELRFRFDKLVTNGDLALTDVWLAGFDLGKKMAVVEKLAGMKTAPDMNIKTASTSVRMGPEGITTQNIQFVVDGFGSMTGQGMISPANTLDFKMNAAIQAAQLTSTLGNLSFPFTVEGPSSNPVFRPDVNAIAKTQIKKVETKALDGLLKNLLGGKK